VKVAETRAVYRELSGKASELARTLAFSGIAIIWVFRTTGSSSPTIPRALAIPGGFLVLALSCDLLQYAVGAAFWGGFARRQELSGAASEDEFLAPRWINWPMLVFFWAKIASVGIAYASLLAFIFSRVVPT